KDLADRIQGQIENGGYRLAQKLPSLRSLCTSTGYSMTTVLQAYVELENRGIVESRQRSGYFIKPRIKPLRPLPRVSRREVVPGKVNLDEIIHHLTRDMGDPDVLKLGAVAVDPQFLPVKQLHKQLRAMPKARIPGMIAGYTPPEGDDGLRQQISNLLFALIPDLTIDDIIVTNGCTEALSLSLKAVTNPKDTVIIESPADPWLRKMVKDMSLYALEVPADPQAGIDPDRMAELLEKETVAACILNPNCHNPLGFIMPDSRKIAILEVLEKYDIPVIENDICGDLYFGPRRPNPMKKWDTQSNVLYCSSFSKVLAPGLRIGWVIPGRYQQAVKRLKLNRSLISPALNQALTAGYLKEGGYNRHLRRLRQTIKRQYEYCAAAIHRYFPDNIKMTSPAGGLSIWIELPSGLHGKDVYLAARKQGISILPGFLCSSFDTFDRFIRIGYGGCWSETMEVGIRDIGRIVSHMAGYGIDEPE
ncbi:MAG: PLP-dependent aminotransferase family protein, partial [Desulfobacterales bacterium]|nr:PLP-dependent aminotransferase family protein [Desulfobacterales bacterium]